MRGFSDGPIPWPMTRLKRGQPLHIVCAGLSDAVRRESNQAVAHWWGVSTQTVTRWRKALDVGPTTEGTSRLRHDYFEEPWAEAAREKAHEQSRDPERDAERREKIAAARLGEVLPPHAIEAMQAGHKAKPQSEEARRKMSEAHKRRGTRPPKAGRPWTAEEDALLQELPPPEVAERTGRTLTAVYSRREVLGLPDGRAGRKVPRR